MNREHDKQPRDFGVAGSIPFSDFGHFDQHFVWFFEVSDSFDVFKACKDYWGDKLKDLIKGLGLRESMTPLLLQAVGRFQATDDTLW